MGNTLSPITHDLSPGKYDFYDFPDFNGFNGSTIQRIDNLTDPLISQLAILVWYSATGFT